MSRILMVSSEAAPLAKSGGLADVLGALPPELNALGEECAVVLPRYPSILISPEELVYRNLRVYLGSGFYECDIYRKELRGTPYFLVEHLGLYGRDGLYGDRYGDFGDNHIRYGLLCGVAIGIARYLFPAQIFHAHDWQGGLLPLYLKNFVSGDPAFAGARSVFTIHNLGYQGLTPREKLWEAGVDDRFYRPDMLEFNGAASLLKSGIIFADAITTVSPNYAREIQTPEYGFGLDGLLRARSSALTGILNGCDYEEWNPETDPFLAANYSAKEPAGKAACKRALLEEFGLGHREDRPLVGIVSRLAYQKGFEIVGGVLDEMLAWRDVTFVVLGGGETSLEQMFWTYAARYPDRMIFWKGYNNALAHRIEAGADLFLMPSRYEPCGLNQMYSLRYGTLPVVRATGGLDDTVDGETGFKFWRFEPWDLAECLRYALGVYADSDRWAKMQATAMGRDYSWARSARAYTRLYEELLATTGRLI
ncbi:MAG: glycogen synthase GlgA [Bryobacter sp.]|nr:glycogen synthase GlgA [Bryobacter sp.]